MKTDEYEIDETPFDSADDLLAALDESSAEWPASTWIYRGQNNAKCFLLPPAMRECKIIDNYVAEMFESFLWLTKSDRKHSARVEFKFEQLSHYLFNFLGPTALLHFGVSTPIESISEKDFHEKFRDVYFDTFTCNYVRSGLHSNMEEFLVRAFVELADQVGLFIPKDSFPTKWDRPYTYYEQVQESMRDERNFFTGEECASVTYALARHHGIPTRLLDWSYDARIAAYFAAFTYIDCQPEPERLVVWAVNARRIRNMDVRVIKHRRSEVEFLRAQDGLFIYDVSADRNYWLAGQWIPFEYYFKQLAEEGNCFKYTLPFSERFKVLDDLRNSKILEPFVKPSFDNVANAIMQETVSWEQLLEK